LQIHKANEPPTVKVSPYVLVKYREFDWSGVAPDALKKIVVGPAADYETAVAADFNGDFRPNIALATVAPTASPTSPGEVIVLLNKTPSRR